MTLILHYHYKYMYVYVCFVCVCACMNIYIYIYIYILCAVIERIGILTDLCVFSLPEPTCTKQDWKHSSLFCHTTRNNYFQPCQLEFCHIQSRLLIIKMIWHLKVKCLENNGWLDTLASLGAAILDQLSFALPKHHCHSHHNICET